ncbi:MAG: hypothetical protein US60_C0015G0035 [Microgenomates group bacterium GW2011_GWC1_37_8]|uniref:Glycosyltransferase RgtA/B/C/D-like domain-containing protein n=1 Tax=Candidatus Woesebacteria bacterium GW2011_GWB1_38_8 TaxID=1618570 RepID=A0A0G0LDS6_9BACT|nr:MAG: hypothetical protein US60_C0015G0035 [Microgenomates group bacterium GW2011_GWC1_37_8]KKQ86075.1 MAG: hypothetical protein UT08_C0002G0097 [Candidatus Woesebacteria bacterium GW2011_GWB1_38_8]
MNSLLTKIQKYKFEVIFFSLLFLFSNLLMWKTLRSTSNGDLLIAAKAWSDFSANIPVIRSFSLGHNFPPQYPLFAGPPIRYHFVFYALVGLLEKIGIPLDWALNTLSALSFFALLSLIYFVSKRLFGRKSVGVAAVMLFLFNSSFAFLEYFKKNPFALQAPLKILLNREFSSFGPFDGNVVSAFWNLNIYTNQRHLALGYSFLILFFLLFVIFAKKPKSLTYHKACLLGTFIGFLPFIHLSTFGMLIVSLLIFFVVYKALRGKIIVIFICAGLIAFPQFLYMGFPQNIVGLYNPGYLIDNLNFANFAKYWFYNLGFSAITAPIGFLLIKKDLRKIFIPFFVFFIIGNLFRFTPSMIDNHKFFNAAIIGANILSAYFLVYLWIKSAWLKIVAGSIFFFLTLSGIIDLFPIVNDRLLALEDIPKNKTANFILENTHADAVFLNANYIFDPASIAGRKIYLGWAYFPWSLGYDVDTRRANLQQVLNSTDKAFICNLLHKEGINYLEIQNPSTIERVNIDYEFYNSNFIAIYRKGSELVIYDLSKSCNISYL